MTPLPTTANATLGPNMAALRAHLAGHQRHLKAVKGLALSSIAGYGKDLGAFFDYLLGLGGDPGIKDIDRDLTINYLSSLVNRGQGPATRNRKLAALKSFIAFLLEEKLLEADPLALVKSAKHQRALPKPMSEAEIKRLFGSLATPLPLTRVQDEPFQAADHARDVLTFELLYGSGLRVSEVCGLRLGSFELDNETGPQVRVRGKGAKDRIVPLSFLTVKALKVHLKHRGEPKGKEPLFVGRQGRQLSTNFVESRMKLYLINAGLNTDHTPHSLRHSYATHMLANGAHIKAIQYSMGHSSSATTDVYMAIANSMVQGEYRKSHPRDRMEV